MSPFNMSPTLSGHSPTPPSLVHHSNSNLWNDHHHISSHHSAGGVNHSHHGLLTTASHHGIHALDHGYNMYNSGKEKLQLMIFNAFRIQFNASSQSGSDLKGI